MSKEKYWVDVPDYTTIANPQEEETWKNLGEFDSREEAIAWAMLYLGADNEGKIQVVTGGPTI